MKTSGTPRRSFLKTVALAANAPAAMAQSEKPAPPAATTPPAAPPSPPPVTYPRTFAGRRLAQIAFPLGGIGAGCVSLGGRGQLRDWEVFNRADKGHTIPYTFPAVWVKMGNAKPVARVLEIRFGPPYQSTAGLNPAAVSGLSRMAGGAFTGEYPLARLDFRDARVPVRISLEAFTPVVPLDAEESGLPAAVLRYKVTNPSAQPARVSIAFSMENPVGVERAGSARGETAAGRRNEYREGASIAGIVMTNPAAAADAPLAGSFVLCVRDPGLGQVTRLSGWPQAKWWASPLLFWDDFVEDGALGPEAEARNKVASLCLEREIAPGKSADFEFLLAWNFPNRTPAWCGWSAPRGDENAIIGNHYSKRFPDAWAVAEYLAGQLPSLEKRMRAFLAAMRDTSLPAAVKEAAMSNLSTLASTTCFRTADGRFRGFEGVNDQRGCCYGNCDHVWNYESATEFLFPTLARSMREAAFELSTRLNGQMPIRVQLPEGKQTGGITAADGQMGQIIKTYLDWQLCGDDAWLRTMWPQVKKALEFCWIPGGWDANRDGVMEGVQHNTYDVEFFGPNPMCGVFYLGALRASEEMARAVGETGAADDYHRLFESGSKWIDANLFNGEYYIQKIQGAAKDKIAKDLLSTMGADNTERPDFQVGEGCLVDQLVGQYVADFAGLGNLLDAAHIRKTLASIYKYNYKRSLYDHESVQRIFALNDEAALIICDYGKVKRPKVPFSYFAEVMTGFEYSAAVLMLWHGMVKEGVECIENIRRRYDGERRNPWDEAECGHHYARAMASWSAIVALSGFRYSAPKHRIEVAPKIDTTPFRSFWSTGAGWGTFTIEPKDNASQFTLRVAEGRLVASSLEVRGRTKTFTDAIAVTPERPLVVVL